MAALLPKIEQLFRTKFSTSCTAPAAAGTTYVLNLVVLEYYLIVVYTRAPLQLCTALCTHTAVRVHILVPVYDGLF